MTSELMACREALIARKKENDTLRAELDQLKDAIRRAYDLVAPRGEVGKILGPILGEQP